MKAELDDIDKRLVNLIQRDFPLLEEPFSALGESLGISGEQAINRIEKLKKDGIVRLIGPVFDTRKLGYQTTLIAMKVAESRLDKAAQIINEHPGISHAYQRNNDLNFWFTLALTSDADMHSELQRLKELIRAETVLDLPALRVFKIGAYFDMYDDNSSPNTGINHKQQLDEASCLSVADRDVINNIEQDIPLVKQPFNANSAELGMDANQFLDRIRSLKERGIIRRFGAAINHTSAGFAANAMACWIAAPEVVEIAGQKLAELRQVSHCYERKTNPLWPYNLFAMIHGHTRDICKDIASRISIESGLENYVLLFSTREFKKTRINYTV